VSGGRQSSVEGEGEEGGCLRVALVKEVFIVSGARAEFENRVTKHCFGQFLLVHGPCPPSRPNRQCAGFRHRRTSGHPFLSYYGYYILWLLFAI
jgi:hypothetical protein